MKKFLLSIFAVMLAVFSVQAEEYSYTFTSKQFSANGTKTLNSVNWTLAGNGNYWGYDATKGQQFGSGNYPYKSLTLSTSGIEGTISKIVINTSGASSIAGSCTVTVGGTQFGKKITLTKTATSYTLTGNASGNIVLSYTQTSSKAIYIKSITITYTPKSGEGGDDEVVKAASPSLPESCSFEGEKEIEITNNTEGATVFYSTDGVTFNEYTEPFTIYATTTVTAYAQIGDDETTKSSEVFAKYTKIEPKTIAEVIAAGAGEAMTTGTVVATYNSGFLMSDETGSILVYQGKANIGDFVKVNGTTNKYAGLLQFGAGSTVEKTGTTVVTYPEVTVMDGAAMDEYLEAPYVKYVEYTGELTISGNYYNVAIEGATKAQGSISYPATGLVTAENGAIVKVTGYTIGVSSNMYVNTMAVKVEVVEEGHVELPTVSVVDGAEVELGTEITITPAANNTVTYSVNGADAVEITEETIITADVLGEMTLDVTSTYDGQTLTATYTFVVVPVVVKETATLTFDNTSKRTEFSTSKQVWTENGVTFTNEKGSSTTNVAEYANPVRCYKSSDITITSEQKFNKIIFDCVIENSSKDYATPLKETIGSNVTISDDIVTVEFDEPVSTFTIKTLKGQVRIDELTVVYAVEEVPSYTLSVTDAGYATLFLDFAAAIPEDVEVYTVTAVNTGYVTLTQVTGVLPANTGVIVKAAEANYTFAYSTETPATVTGNLLEGTATAEEKDFEAYVLGNNGGVGLYKAKMTDGVWLNNANKAYLPAPKNAQGIASYSFRFPDTTGVDDVVVENEVKTIFDITGRKVEAITAPGIYIVNGKKVLVK